MKSEIYCIMFTGLPLTDDGRTLLFLFARKMAKEQKDREKIKSGEFEGHISTKWHRRGMGGTFGIEFSAKLETENGSTEINYLVSMAKFKLEDGEWMNIPMPPSMMPYSLN